MLVPEDVLVASARRRTRAFNPGRLVGVALSRRPTTSGDGARHDTVGKTGRP